MHRGHRLCWALVPWLLSCMSCAHQGELRASERTAIVAAIERQLEAFRRDDAASAFAFASAAIQAEFATPEDFLTAVKPFYEPVYRPRRTGGFTDLYVIDGQLTRPALLVGPSGDFVDTLKTKNPCST